MLYSISAVMHSLCMRGAINPDNFKIIIPFISNFFNDGDFTLTVKVGTSIANYCTEDLKSD